MKADQNNKYDIITYYRDFRSCAGLCVGKKNASFHFVVSYETIMGVASVVWCNNGA